MIHQEVYDFLQVKKKTHKNPFFEKWLRTKQAQGSNEATKIRTINVVKNCSEIIYMLIEDKLTTIKLVQEFLHMIYSELGYQEIKLSLFYDNELKWVDPVAIKKVEELFDFILPILKDKLRESNLNNYFSITVKNIKNQIKHLNVTYLTNVKEIKKECNRKDKHALKDIVLIYKGKKLEDTILKYTGLTDGDTIYIVWIKKKPPVYTPPPLQIRASEEYPQKGMSASAPAPSSKSRFTVSNYYNSDDDDDYDELRSMFG